MQNIELQSKEHSILRRVALSSFVSGAGYSLFLAFNQLGWFFQFSELLRQEQGLLPLLILVCLVCGTLILSLRRPSHLTLRVLISVPVLLLLAGTAQAGAITLTFFPVALLVLVLAVPKRFRLPSGVLLWGLFAGASFIPAQELDWPLHMRMLAFNAVVIWPLITLIDIGNLVEVRKKLALERLLLSAAWASVAILVLDPVALHGLVGIALTFGTWWWLRSIEEVSRRAKLWMVALTIIMYFNNLYNAGQLPAQSLAIYLVFSFVLFSPLRATALGAIYTLLVLYGLLHFETDLIIPLALRNISAAILLLLGLYALVASREFGAEQRFEKLAVGSGVTNLLISVVIVAQRPIVVKHWN